MCLKRCCGCEWKAVARTTKKFKLLSKSGILSTQLSDLCRRYRLPGKTQSGSPWQCAHFPLPKPAVSGTSRLLSFKITTVLDNSAKFQTILKVERRGRESLKAIEVRVIDNDLEKAMRVLKKKIQNDGLFKRLKLKKSYEKPSEFRRRKQREALRRQRIAAAKKSRYRFR